MVPLLAVLALAAPDGGTGAAPPPSSTPAPAESPPPTAAATRAAARAEHAEAMVRLRAGDFAGAAELFARAVDREPRNAALATDLGFALGKAGRRPEAETVLRGAVDKDPHRYYAYANLADLLAEDPTRWERRDAIVAYLDKGLEALKEDRKGRFILLLGIAGFERSVGRTVAARARLQPLLAREAPPLSRAQRKRVLDLVDAIALDERARALEDWPAPTLSSASKDREFTAIDLLGHKQPDQALALLDFLCDDYPSAAALRLLRAEALEALGRLDEAARDLEIAVNLAPSSAQAWRALGRLLAAHGGALELDRADEALRQALTLEPAWTDLRELRAQIVRRRAVVVSAPAPRSVPPSEHARALYQQAEEWLDVGDPIGSGRELVEQALADSPGYVAAALSLYALTGTVPQATVDALHDDGPALWTLADGVRKLGKGEAYAPDVEALIRPWIDRAVELDVQEARFSRATARAVAGNREGALADLIAYVAREPSPDHLAEARALRAGLGEVRDPSAGPVSNSREARLSPQLLARIRLLEDRPEAALQALGGSCVAGLPEDRLVDIGRVEEYMDRRTEARRCYELAAQAGDRSLDRLSRLDARLPDGELRAADRRPLERAASAQNAAAAWALARMSALDGNEIAARADVGRALHLLDDYYDAPAHYDASDADLWIPAARAAQREWSAAWSAAERARRARRRTIELGVAMGALIVFTWLAHRRWRGRTMEAALRRRPALFPEVARAVAELRHDVLKHRAGVLGAALDPAVPTGEILRALTEPRPTSTVVAGLYGRLEQAARGAGAPLRPLAREPVFGALVRDLARAELLASRLPEGRDALAAIDRRLRGEHADALDALLRLGPRTRLDVAALSRWIAAVEVEARRGGSGWTAPGLSLADLDLDFPVELDALAVIFTNLLRNAAAAVADRPDARVIIRADRERDVTGRQWVTLLIGDSAEAPLTLESIEARESGRGLAIVRDLVRAWRGHLLVRPEAAPLSKLVGASFPL